MGWSRTARRCPPIFRSIRCPRPGSAYAEVSLPAGGDAKAIEQDMRAILTKVAKNGVPAELVEAAKQQERRTRRQEKNSIAGLASVWSDAVALYHLRYPDQDLERIEKVTVADVNRVARRYLRLDRAISALLLPQRSGKPVASGGGFGGQETIALGEAKPTQLPDWAQSALSRLSVPASTLNPTVSTLANGLTLIVQPENVSDTVARLRPYPQPGADRNAAGQGRRRPASRTAALLRHRASGPSRLREGLGRNRRQRTRRNGFFAPGPVERFRSRRRASGRTTN